MDYYGRLALAVAVAVVTAASTNRVAAWGWQQPQQPQPLAPCMYVFGDSLVDNGNNNGMLSLARANYRPYGIDFHEQGAAPGRFTNGRTMVDFLSDSLRLRPPLLPPYATARPADLPRGVNFASGASGVLPETGNNLGGHYPLSEQVDHFGLAVSEMGNSSASSEFGRFRGNATKVAEHLGRCIFFVGMGSNDYLNNYFMPDYYDTARRYSPRDYAALLLQGYAAQVARLYGLGARKFVVAGVGQIGCIPYELARMNDDDNRPSSAGHSSNNHQSVASQDIAISIGIGGGGGIGVGGGRGGRSSPMPLPYTDGGNGNGNGNSNGNGNGNNNGNGNGNGNGNTSPAPGAGVCNETINSAIDIYNRGLLAMVKRFNNRGGAQQQQQMRGARFVFLDTVQSGRDIAANAAAHGFTVLDRGCCGVGRNNGQITCLPLQRPCDDRSKSGSKYVFWDAFHPTEAAHRIYAAKAFGSNSTNEAYPINVSQLAAI